MYFNELKYCYPAACRASALWRRCPTKRFLLKVPNKNLRVFSRRLSCSIAAACAVGDTPSSCAALHRLLCCRGFCRSRTFNNLLVDPSLRRASALWLSSAFQLCWAYALCLQSVFDLRLSLRLLPIAIFNLRQRTRDLAACHPFSHPSRAFASNQTVFFVVCQWRRSYDLASCKLLLQLEDGRVTLLLLR